MSLSTFAAAAEKVPVPSNSQSPRLFPIKAVALQQLRDRVAGGRFSGPAIHKLHSQASKAVLNAHARHRPSPSEAVDQERVLPAG